MNCLQDQQTLDEEVYQAHLTQLLTLFPLRDLESCERPRKTPAPAFQHFIQLLKCPLCEEIMNVPVYLQCSHRVCKNCWLRHKSPGSLIKRCPFCLAPASGQKQPNQDSFLADLIHKIDLWLLKWEEQEFSALKRERESPSTNQEKVKLFKSNDETAIALKKECSQQNQLHLESNKKTNKGEILEWDIKKQEKVTRVLHVVKAQPMATVIPKAHQQLHNAAVGIKAAQILVKIRLQKMPNDLITPSLGMEEIVLTCSNQTCIIATLIADHLNISPKLVNLFVKNGPKYKQLHSRDRISHIFSTAQSYHPQSTVLQAFLKSNSAAGPARQNPPFSSLKPSATVYYKIRLSSMELQWPRDMQGS